MMSRKEEVLESTTSMREVVLASTTLMKMEEQTNQKQWLAEERLRQLRYRDLRRHCWPEGLQMRWGWRRRDQASAKEHSGRPPRHQQCKQGKPWRELLGCKKLPEHQSGSE